MIGSLLVLKELVKNIEKTITRGQDETIFNVFLCSNDNQYIVGA